jgi:hypothetical protein
MGFFIANPACRLFSSASKLAIARVWSSSCASVPAFAATYYDADKKRLFISAKCRQEKLWFQLIHFFFLGGGGGR